jgi:hypothetical protein
VPWKRSKATRKHENQMWKISVPIQSLRVHVLADITNTIDKSTSACQAKPSSSRLDHNYIGKKKAQTSNVDKKCESSKCEGTDERPQLADIKNVNDKSCQAKPSKTD